jgi:hydroxyquinol 1,2-dioxygenase
MRNLTEANLTEAVVAKLARVADPRFKEIMTSLIQHVHAFVREVELTEEEWFEAIKFLTATGQKCNDKRQEFILLSDVLGVSMLVDAINHRMPPGRNRIHGAWAVLRARCARARERRGPYQGRKGRW